MSNHSISSDSDAGLKMIPAPDYSRGIEYYEESQGSQKEAALFHALKAALDFPADPETVGQLLADVIAATVKVYGEYSTWEVWFPFQTLVEWTPPDDPAMDCLVEALLNLHRRDDTIVNPPTRITGRLEKATEAIKWIDDGEFWRKTRHWMDGPGCSTIENFKSSQAFMARYSGSARGLDPPLWIGISRLSLALEEPFDKEEATSESEKSVMRKYNAMDMWIALEWLIHCAEPLRDFMTEDVNEEDGLDRLDYIPVGSLYPDLPPRSVHRWALWTSKIERLACLIPDYHDELRIHMLAAHKAIMKADKRAITKQGTERKEADEETDIHEAVLTMSREAIAIDYLVLEPGEQEPSYEPLPSPPPPLTFFDEDLAQDEKSVLEGESPIEESEGDEESIEKVKSPEKKKSLGRRLFRAFLQKWPRRTRSESEGS